MHTGRLTIFSRNTLFSVMIAALLFIMVSGVSVANAKSALSVSQVGIGNYTIVFVSRKIPANGSAYYNATGSLPGVQPWGRFQIAAPGKLMIREANGSLRILVDGSKPTVASLNLIDVNAPDVSYDATKIVFAGLPSGSYDLGPMNNPGAWRIYAINVDGTGLRQITFSDRNINLSQFGNVASNFTGYDDTDPVWLPDGRIVFSSTRWPSFGMYGAAHTSNLYVVNESGTDLHRITAERNGGERPVIDPLTGKIVYSRWWRNFRLGTNNMATMVAPEGGFIMKDGICALSHQGAECQQAGGLTNLERNSWHLATINPDGTGLAQFAGRSNSTFIGENINSAYGGAFAPDGSFYANFFPMSNGTEAAGFGGIRRYQRGANGYTSIIGITTRDESVQQFVRTNPNSYGVYVGNYAAEPAVLPDGGLVISWAANVTQDYGLYTINSDGSSLTLLYDNPGTTELRTRLVIPRSVPPIIPDKVTKVASQLPPLAQGPYDIDGTFTFKDLNVYFNAPVDTDIISAIPIGSANSIRFFIDHQRSQQRGSFETLDWPILLNETPINPDGSITTSSPANVPLFEQIRTSLPGYSIPLSGRGASPNERPGAAHVAGMNFGRTGDVVTCVGCHAGHTLIPVPANPADAQWTNLAPGATVSYSSLHTSLPNGDGAVDRHVKLRIAYNNHYRYWLSREGQNPNTQWLQLTFPVPVTVRTVRLYNIPSTESAVKVLNTTVKLYSDAAGTNQVATKTSGALSENGTDVAFSNVRIRVVRIEFNSVNGSTAGLGEVEVIASGADIPSSTISGSTSVANVLLKNQNETLATSGSDGTYSILVPNGWSGMVTPTHACYTFNPTNRTYNSIAVNQTSQDYAATLVPSSYTITGNTGMAGAMLRYMDGTLKTVTSDGSGNYSITVPCDWSGTVTPSLADTTLDLGFIPSSRMYTNVTTNQTGQNYTVKRLFSDLRMWTTDFNYNTQGWRVEKHPRMMADVNGDGKDDIIGYGYDGVWVSLSTGNSFAPVTMWTNDYSYTAQGWRTELHPRMVGDVNGDGKADLVGFGYSGVWIALSTGNSFAPVTMWTTDFNYNTQGWRVEKHPRMLADVNGDGKDDIIGYGYDGVWVALSTGTSFAPVTMWTTDYSYTAQGWRIGLHPRMVGDVNGDGKADLVGFGYTGVWIALSTGSSFAPVTMWTTDFNYNTQGWRVEKHPRLMADVNGDGKDDIIGYGYDGVWIALSTGNSFAPVSMWTNNYSYTAQGWRVELHPRMVGDPNGDGRVDLVGFGYSGVWINK